MLPGYCPVRSLDHGAYVRIRAPILRNLRFHALYNPAMLLALVSAAAIAPPTSGNDICLAMIPPRLAIQLARDNSDYALPVTADAPLERLLANAEAGGWPCPFVVIGDF